MYACLWDESGRGRLDKFFYCEQTKFRFFFCFLGLDNFFVVLLFNGGNAANKKRGRKPTTTTSFVCTFVATTAGLTVLNVTYFLLRFFGKQNTSSTRECVCMRVYV